MARLLLLPGLGADERLFAGLGELCLPVIVPRLPEPLRHENMTAYALRVVSLLQPRPEDWIGGASFGGMVAAAIARHRPVRGVVLIGSALSSAALPGPVRGLARIACRLPFGLVRSLLARPTILSHAFGTLTPEQSRLVADMIASAPERLLREGARLVAGYFPETPLLCPVHALHGDQDRLMHAPPIPGCRTVSGAGHALSITHPQDVTVFLHELLCR